MTPAETAPAVGKKISANLRGMMWMALAGLAFVGFTGVVRHLGSDMHPAQAAFIRYVIGLCIFAPYFLRLRRRHFREANLKLHLLRGLVHGTGVLLWFYAMTRIPIADITALGFTAPVFATLGAALFLGERLQLRRIGAVIMGLAGALVILRPGFAAVDLGAVAMLIAAPLFAASELLTKLLIRKESELAVVAYLSIIVTLITCLPALMVWRPPTLEEVAWLGVTAILATLSHLFIARAFRWAEMGVTQPVKFLQLLWATLLGYYAFAEVPDVWTWVGGGIIVASATYIARREARLRKTPTGDVNP
jgi:drug/metabolite transporter (DMT)-like permease